MEKHNTQPQIFISYAREDAEAAGQLYHFLSDAGYKPWMDTMDILPGERWLDSIQDAIERSDFFLACLSENSVDKRGILQKEIKSALDAREGMLEGDIYLIPVRLELCDVPNRLSEFQWVDLFEEDGWERLSKAIEKGIERRTSNDSNDSKEPSREKRRKEMVEVKGKVTPSKRIRIHPRLIGSLIGLFLVFFSPLFYNNYIFHASRPNLPDVCLAPTEKIHVGIARVPGCSPDAQFKLVEELQGENNISTISTLPEKFLSSRDVWGQADGYDLVIWGECIRDVDHISLTFELVSSRSPVEVYEPPTFHANGNISDLIDAVRALIRYQYGDYLSAANIFDGLNGNIESEELPLFYANSLLFNRNYPDAETTFTILLRRESRYAAALHNNLGVLINNKEVSVYKESLHQGLAEFDRALTASERNNPLDIRNIDVKTIALFNRSRIYLSTGRYSEALNDCNVARNTNQNSALPLVCLADYGMTYYRYTSINLPGLLPLNAIGQDLENADAIDPHPPVTHFLRAVWHLDHIWKQKQDAVDQFAAYILNMEDQVCLATDQLLVDDTLNLVNQYSK